MTVHRDGQTWLTKLERIGELSASDKAIVFNNLGHIMSADMLKEQYHLLDRNKAVGIDDVTKGMYGKQLDKNISSLIQRIRRNTYKPKPARLVQIPKEDGSSRPLAISCLEDKLVQLAVSKILGKIYEPIFSPSSYGFRPNKSCHDALRALMKSVYPNMNGAIVEIDIRKYFNTIPHLELMKMLQNKISDKRLLRLIEILIKAPIKMGKTEIVKNTSGCPQGSILSPILANIYLHHVIDEWFEEIRHSHIRGRAELIRYADDMVFTFERQSEAIRFYKVLPKRFAKFGLTMHSEKSQLIPSGLGCANRASIKGKRLPTYKFLGFTCYWGKSRKGYWRLKYSSRKDRFAGKLKRMRKYLRNNLTKDTTTTVKTVMRVVNGWMNYHNISDNAHRVEAFRNESMRIIFNWMNRKGRKHPITWARFNDYLVTVGFPKPGRTISMFKAPLKMRMGR
jgi:RNA-directed DNA polymerase